MWTDFQEAGRPKNSEEGDFYIYTKDDFAYGYKFNRKGADSLIGFDASDACMEGDYV